MYDDDGDDDDDDDGNHNDGADDICFTLKETITKSRVVQRRQKMCCSNESNMLRPTMFDNV